MDCGNVLEINDDIFNKTNNSTDGYYNICKTCQVARRRNGSEEGFKKCIHCNNTYPLTRDYFQPEKRCIDGYRNVCWKCTGRDFFPDYANESWTENDILIVKNNYEQLNINDIIPLLSIKRTEKAIMHMAQKLGIRKIENHIGNYNDIKYKFIDNILHKYCKSCGRYLPLTYDYFPKDVSCTVQFRNICRECKGENFRIDSNVHVWEDKEIKILEKYYSHMTNNELYKIHLPYISIDKIIRKANSLRLYKTEEALQKCSQEVGDFHAKRLLGLNKWVNDDNPQYNSQRFGELNPNYKGGISALSQELRRNIKQWKIDSMENSNYKCFFSGRRFDDIHHLYSFDNIVKDTLKETELPLYENISWYTQDKLHQLISKCLEIHYRYPLGICLQEKYHLKFHAEFGFGGNTIEQFEEFINNYYSGKYKDLEEVG